MQRNRIAAAALALSLITGPSLAQKTQTPLLKVIDTALQKAIKQYKVMGANLPADVLPKTYYPLTKKIRDQQIELVVQWLLPRHVELPV